MAPRYLHKRLTVTQWKMLEGQVRDSIRNLRDRRTIERNGAMIELIDTALVGYEKLLADLGEQDEQG